MTGAKRYCNMLRRRLRRRPRPKPPPPGDPFTVTTLMIGRRPTEWLRCAVCDRLMYRDPYRSDLGILTLHWMSEHPERWLELHPEDGAYLRPASQHPGSDRQVPASPSQPPPQYSLPHGP